jgi:ATP-binding cassette subfamily F protein 3
LVTKVFEFRQKKIKEHLGGIYEFLNRRQIGSLAEIEKKDRAGTSLLTKDETTNKQAFINRKEYDREVRKLETSIGKAEQRIGNLEKEMSNFENKIANPATDPESMKAPDFYHAYNNIQAELKQQMVIWEHLQNDLEELKNKRI